MSKYDIILVTDTHGWSYQNSKKSWERGSGAHRIASHLRTYGYSVLVIDFSSYITFDIWSDICEHAIGSNTLMIGFSTTWWPYRNINKVYGKQELITAFNHSPEVNDMLYKHGQTLTIAAGTGNLAEWINVAKEINPKIKIVVGGPKIANYFDMPADHFFAGFGETQIIDFLQQPKRIWPRVINHDPEAKNKDFDFKYSCTHYTKESFIQPYEALSIEFARGCRFKCTFCRYQLIGRKDVASYVKTSESIYSEMLENYNQWGTTSYNILDDTLNDSIEKLEIIASAVRRLPFKPKFWSYTRIDMIYMHPEQIELLHEIGLVDTFMGLDTFHPVAARAINKGMDASKRKEALYKCKEVWGKDITIIGGYIIGLPGEPKSHIEQVAEWLRTPDCPVYFIPFSALTILNNIELTKYNQKSIIDSDPSKFGYTIEKGDGIHAVWLKDDDSGIHTSNDALALAQQLNQEQIKIKKSIGIPPNSIYSKKIFEEPIWYFDSLLNELKTT